MPRYICAYRNECSGVNTQVNILFFLTPKSDVAYIFEDETLRQTLEKMEHRKFSCIPLLSLDGKYKGTISEGDLLWGMKTLNVPNLKAAEGISIMAIPRRATYKAVHADSDMEDRSFLQTPVCLFSLYSLSLVGLLFRMPSPAYKTAGYF